MICVIAPNESVAWIQLVNVHCMKSNMCIGFIMCIEESWIQPASPFPLITPGTQRLTHPPGRHRG